jgi:hypothetical protein
MYSRLPHTTESRRGIAQYGVLQVYLSARLLGRNNNFRMRPGAVDAVVDLSTYIYHIICNTPASNVPNCLVSDYDLA